MLNNFWESKPGVAHTQRHVFVDVPGKHFFPIARQPICIHPAVSSKGEETIRFILAQTMYRYLYDLAYSELEVINAGSLIVANNKYSVDFPVELSQAALSVIIDEAYHAYVARDYISQVIEKTNITPIQRDVDKTLEAAIAIAGQGLNDDLKTTLFLLGVCIGENSLTQDLIEISKITAVNESFYLLMRDHVKDEGRHTGIFKKLFKFIWEALNPAEKNTIGDCLLTLMKAYLQYDEQISFDRLLLSRAGFEPAEVDGIIEDTHVGNTFLLETNPTVKNIMKLFENVGLFSNTATRVTFEHAGLLSTEYA